MPRSFIIFFLMTIVFMSSCKINKSNLIAPVSDLGHVDLVLDSAAFHDILKDSFLVNEFAVVMQDTTMYAKPSYDIYLLGGEAFLHVSLAKAYWENKAGSGVMIFQARKPGQGDSLLLSWKQFFKDSLDFHTFQGADFELEEILPYRVKDTTKPKLPNFTPILTSYSSQAYKNWGFNDSVIANGLSMKSFMESWNLASQSRLFHKLTSLHVQLTKQEFTEMESALLAVGYTHQKDHFIHSLNPKVVYTITEVPVVPRYTRIEIEMNRAVAQRTIELGTMYAVRVNGRKFILEATK